MKVLKHNFKGSKTQGTTYTFYTKDRVRLEHLKNLMSVHDIPEDAHILIYPTDMLGRRKIVFTTFSY